MNEETKAVGDAINAARVQLAIAAANALERNDYALSEKLIAMMIATQRQIPAEWTAEYDRKRLESIRKAA